MRKVIQIACEAKQEGIYALCDDGTMWSKSHSSNYWVQIPDVPQSVSNWEVKLKSFKGEDITTHESKLFATEGEAWRFMYHWNSTNQYSWAASPTEIIS